MLLKVTYIWCYLQLKCKDNMFAKGDDSNAMKSFQQKEFWKPENVIFADLPNQSSLLLIKLEFVENKCDTTSLLYLGLCGLLE